MGVFGRAGGANFDAAQSEWLGFPAPTTGVSSSGVFCISFCENFTQRVPAKILETNWWCMVWLVMSNELLSL